MQPLRSAMPLQVVQPRSMQLQAQPALLSMRPALRLTQPYPPSEWVGW